MTTWRMIESATQPAAVTVDNGTPATTAAFTPVSGTLLLASLVSDSFGAAAQGNVTDSTGGTWTLGIRSNVVDISGGTIGSSAEVWWRYIYQGGTSMTVSTPLGGGNVTSGELVVRQILGANPIQNGPTAGNGTGTPGTVAISLTNQHIGSRIYGMAYNWTDSTLYTANANTVIYQQHANSFNGGSYNAFRGITDTTTLSSVSYGCTDSKAYQIVAMEIIPMPLPPAEIQQAMSPAARRSYWW